MIHNFIVNTLVGLGIDVIDLGLSTTPTVEIAVPEKQMECNSNCFHTKQWNALKLLNEKGEFLTVSKAKNPYYC
jgi:phosphomannomutase